MLEMAQMLTLARIAHWTRRTAMAARQGESAEWTFCAAEANR